PGRGRRRPGMPHRGDGAYAAGSADPTAGRGPGSQIGVVEPMTLKETLVSAFRTPRGRHSAAKADDEQVPAPAGLDPGAFQVLAHTLIADLFAAGLRVQNLAARAPSDVQQELEE